MVHDIWEQAPLTLQQLWHKLVSDKTVHACPERATSRYWYDSLASGIASDFNALVTCNIVQSATLWPRGSWRKRADLTRKLTFCCLGKCPKLGADYLQVWLGSRIYSMFVATTILRSEYLYKRKRTDEIYVCTIILQYPKTWNLIFLVCNIHFQARPLCFCKLPTSKCFCCSTEVRWWVRFCG
jgi:hypothetical protein